MSKRTAAINDLQNEADKLCEDGKNSEAVALMRKALVKYPGNDISLDYANQLPLFEVCREYNLGRSNLLEGRELAEYLQKNIRLFGKAMIECLEYFLNDSIISAKDMSPYTPKIAKEKIEMLEALTRL